MSATQPLAGRTAVVTGASSGIGRAIALSLGNAGAHVFLSGRTRQTMDEAAAKIGADRATVRVGDVRDPAEVRALVDAAVSATGRLDIMVNNAGISYPAAILDGEPDQWQAMLETNVLALLVGCQAAVKAMRACNAEGHVVNISSIAGQRADSGVYGATKHAVNCISATLRRELEGDAIRVVNVMPGAVATNFARNFDPAVIQGLIGASGLEVELTPGEHLPDEVLDRLQPTLKQMLCSPDDVASAVLYAITQPIEVNVADIVVRPPRQLNL